MLFVGNFLSESGTHRTYCEDMTDRLEARRWRVVRTSSHIGRLSRLGDMVRTTWSRRDDYEIAHVDVFSGAAFFWAEAVCFELRRLRKPYVLTLRGGNLPGFSRRWPRRTRRLLSSASMVTAPSGFLQVAMSDHAPHIDVVPNAVDVSHYPFVLREQPSPRLVWLRAFHAVYNPTMAVEVLARACIRNDATTLRMIGADKGDGSLEAVRLRARELGVEDRLHIIEGVPKREVAHHLASGDIFLNTANVDNSPVSVLEAMACGMCVVSTSVGGIPYMLRNEQDALLVPAGDAAMMADAVERILMDPAISRNLSATARERALACDWTPILERWEQLFTQVIAHA